MKGWCVNMARKKSRGLKDITKAMNELVQKRQEIKNRMSDVLMTNLLTDDTAMLLDDCTDTELRKISDKIGSILPEMLDEVRNEKTGNKQVEVSETVADDVPEPAEDRKKAVHNLFDTAVIPDDYAEKYGRIIKPASGTAQTGEEQQPLKASREY